MKMALQVDWSSSMLISQLTEGTMDEPIAFNPDASYEVRYNGVRFAEIHKGLFYEGKDRDLNTGEILDGKLFINGTPVGIVSGLTITRVNDSTDFELHPIL